MYKEKRISKGEFVPIRGLNYHVRVWEPTALHATAASAGPPQARPAPSGLGPAAPDLQVQVWTGSRCEASGELRPARCSEVHAVTSVGANSLPPLVLVHGWMDVAASYQFMVDAFSDAFAAGRTIIAPDWRGFGHTPSAREGQADSYLFADYLADLDFLLDHYAGDRPVDLVGHSMGGNVAMMYAGVRPARIRKLVNLEGFGMPASQPSQAPGRYVKWINELKTLHRGELTLKAYDALEGVSQRLMKTNRRLPVDQATWLAAHWSQPNSAGKWEVLGEAGHKVTSANLYQIEETLAIYRSITAPVLAVEASDDSLGLWWKGQYDLAEYHERLRQVAQCTVAVIDDAGHMLHHDQPQALAQLIEGFLS